MGQSADEIREEIGRNRADATQKIDQLERQVQGNAEHMRHQVEDTADHLRGQVKGTVDDTIESVKNFDWQQQIQERPLVSLGAAFVGGIVLGSMADGASGGQQHQQSQFSQGSSGQGGSMGRSIRSAAQRSGLEESLSNAGAALVGSVTDQLKSRVDQNFPGFSEKMDTAHSQRGDLADKTRATQPNS